VDILTLAVTVKVNDGVVIAADSATTITQNNPDGSQFINVYDNANKIFHLHKKLPVGIITWGNGGLGTSSIGTLIKDFRKILTDGAIDENNYTIEEISNAFKDFILPKYESTYRHHPVNIWPYTGFTIAGYSSNAELPEEWRLSLENGDCTANLLRGQDMTGSAWSGQPEALNRLIKGYSAGLEHVLQISGIDQPKIQEILTNAQTLQAPFVIPSMPIADVIDLCEYYLDLTINYVKYSPGYQTVGGPIEIASITKYEGFKWIKRKLYFKNDLNPEV
jgi:hypothetical protein